MLHLVIDLLSTNLGVQQEAVVLLFALIQSYLISLFYSLFLRNLEIFNRTRLRSYYFLITGLLLVYWAYGLDLIHSFVNCSVCFLSLKYLHSRTALIANFIFVLVYLLCGYKANQIDWNYSLTWTMPQCILTLRLIALSFDLNDKPKSKSFVAKDFGHIDSSLRHLPNFIDFLSFCFFPGAFFVGPLFPYISYEKFLKSNKFDSNKIRISLHRIFGSFLITAIYLIGSKFWPVDYLLSDEFKQSSLFFKLTSIAIVSKIYMYKYILSWLIAESACMVSGLAHNDFGVYLNVNYIQFETARSFTAIIKSYNITTNNFAFRFIYRRLKFLGNIYLSQLITLAFLSIWHGFESGYHMAFSIEFLILYFEKNLTRIIEQKNLWKNFSFRYSDWILCVAGKLYTFYFIGYGFLPFMLLYYELWMPIFKSIYFIVHLLLGLYILCSLPPI
ncbi:lysophospholipid acyltransferase 5-like protein [Sarcoptes scabiei]|uniref:Lysophospholipid acyltransferase 5 n=1 Tax=Sarcoptes scabiei TaxID=52283 RepID=A0A132A1L6_SARSC|nr:lysophospholipid acyltransferase 5-like protein [Sarcoptes scabiei]